MSKASSRRAIAAAITAIALACAGYWYATRIPKLAKRSVRIGVDQAAPYHTWEEGYGASGFTVDVIREAALRRGIELQWVPRLEGPRSHFARKTVDIWPLVTVPLQVADNLYYTRPWLQNQYAIVWSG